MKTQIAAVIAASVIVFASPTFARQAQSATEKPEFRSPTDFSQTPDGQTRDWLKPVPKAGASIRVTERSGKSTSGRLVSVLPSANQLASDGTNLEVPLADITLVQRNGDSLWNGVAWGAAIAGAISLGYNGDCDSCYSAGELAANRLALVGIGGGVGALLDLIVRDKRIVYRSPSTRSNARRLDIQPILAGDSREFRLAVGW